MKTRNLSRRGTAWAGIFLLFVAGAVVVAADSARAAGPEGAPGTPSTKAAPAHLTYEVLRRWTPGARGIGMEILVSEEATKEQVLALSRHLRKEHGGQPMIWIHIFDSRIAWQRRDDESYLQGEYFKHFLATVTRNSTTGFDKVEWQAKGRDH